MKSHPVDALAGIFSAQSAKTSTRLGSYPAVETRNRYKPASPPNLHGGPQRSESRLITSTPELNGPASHAAFWACPSMLNSVSTAVLAEAPVAESKIRRISKGSS